MTTWVNYRLRASGHCLSHEVRFNPQENSWQHLSPKSDCFHNTSHSNAAFLIQNGAKIVFWRPSTIPPIPRPGQVSK